MQIRPFEPRDSAALAGLAAAFARGETDFVLNPLWESEEELFAEFARHGISPEQHVLVADAEEAGILGMSGFLRFGEDGAGALLCPIVDRAERGRGVGGKLLRAAIGLGEELGITFATAAIGTRNRSGYSLLTAFGFRPVRQHFFMRCEERPVLGKPPIPGLRLELAGEADLPAILELYTAGEFPARSADDLARVAADGRHVHAVARLDGEVVAFVELESHWPKRNWVAFVEVRPELRDRGVATALVAWAVARQLDGGVRAVMLLLSPANRSALRAYEKVGFKRFRVIDVLEKRL